MKRNLPNATMPAALLVLASSVLASSNATASTNTTSTTQMVVPAPSPPKSYKLKCAGYGEKQVFITNAGSGPVPAGTKVTWQLPKSSAVIGGGDVTFPYESGAYTFQQPLNPQGGVQINVPPPSSGGNQGPGPDPATSVLAIAFLRQCTVGPYSPTAQRMFQH